MRYEVRRRDRDDGQIDYVVEDEGGSQVCDVPEDYYEGDVGAQRRAAERIAWALHVQETGPRWPGRSVALRRCRARR